ncbi:carboxylic ester hydrolase-like [Ostrinia nubilalis]|uniref:carboxylic ester hydrolase-like n=1 Tax=Ostrinia nubilalis TaxID=29057 RepID=UPI003082546F
MYRLILFSVLIVSVYCADPKFRTVETEEGPVQGGKYWNGDFYEFYGIPYATAPTGRDKFKAPLPVEPRQGLFESPTENIICQQTAYTGEDDEDEIFLSGKEDCLLMNLMVPEVASEENLVPVVIYIHSGAFAGGSGTMSKVTHVANRDVIGITFNYRVGALGFACLGTEEIPGNAALKDVLAALKWINRNIRKFGGDPDNVTLAGYSVGATIAELMALSRQTDGLIHKIILESGSALTPFAINRHPITTARNIATSIGFNDTGNLKDLNEFYLNASVKDLAIKSLNFFMTNSTFGFAPCIENKNNPQAILTESPLDILKKKDVKPLAVLTGFANMEGLSRASKFDAWSEMMNEKFVDFIPGDLVFKDDKTKESVAKEIYKYYFNEDEVTHDNVRAYIDYFSDCMFKYAIMKSAKLHAAIATRPVYLYEFSYVGELSAKHQFMDKIKGASHRDQTAYVLDFYGYTKKKRDLDTRDRLTWMWSDFAKYEDPTAYESSLINVKWRKYSNDKPYHLSIGSKLQMKKNLFTDSYNFWDKIYEKYYWNPTSVQ